MIFAESGNEKKYDEKFVSGDLREFSSIADLLNTLIKEEHYLVKKFSVTVPFLVGV